MDMGGGQIMLMAPPWTPGYAALIFLMWAIMMVAMMLPSAAPTILLVTALARGPQRADRQACSPRLCAGLDRVQPARDGTAMGSRSGRHAVRDDGRAQRRDLPASADCRGCLSMDATEAGLPAALPLATGVSDASLAPRRRGVRANGVRHGLFCLGCCWMLMALLFVGGLMNLLWIAAPCASRADREDASLGRPHEPR